MAPMGAELALYPTAIDSDCHDPWEVVMRGHAGANVVTVAESITGRRRDRATRNGSGFV